MSRVDGKCEFSGDTRTVARLRNLRSRVARAAAASLFRIAFLVFFSLLFSMFAQCHTVGARQFRRVYTTITSDGVEPRFRLEKLAAAAGLPRGRNAFRESGCDKVISLYK